MGYLSSPIWLLFMLVSSLHRFNAVGVADPTHGYTMIFDHAVPMPEAFTLFTSRWC